MEDKKKDENVEHGDKFSFNEDVASVFSDMLERSIPSYSLMRELVVRIVERDIKYGGLVLDIGTSTGDAIETLVKNHPNTNFIGLEMSDQMIARAKEKFKDNRNVQIKKHDLRQHIHLSENPGTIISCLTVQFTPMEHRLQILRNLYNILASTGKLIFVEKVLGNSAEFDKMLTEVYYQMKMEYGYSYDEIKRKKLALEGVLVPVTAKWNEELLNMSGFKNVECFWRCLNFAGWVATK